MPGDVSGSAGLFDALYAGAPRAVVTQQTSITTAVDADGLSGTITTADPALAAAGEAEFQVNNAFVGPGDHIILTIVSGPADGEHVFADVTSVGSGVFTVVVSNHAAANQADGAMVINFLIIKGR